MLAQQYFSAVVTCALASLVLFATTVAQETYGDMDDATINGAATVCLEPMVAAFKAAIDKEGEKCAKIKLQCDGSNDVTKQSITVHCVNARDKKGIELASNYAILGACIVPGSPDGSKGVAIALELFDRMCDEAIASDAQVIDSDAKAFLDGLQAKLKKELKSPTDATAIVGFTIEQVIKAITKGGECVGVSVSCREADFYGGTLPMVRFNNCKKSTFMKTTTLASDKTKTWGKSPSPNFQMYLSRGTIRGFRAIAPQDNKGLRTSKLLLALRQSFCPVGKRGITTSLKEAEITAAANAVKF